VCTYKSSDPPPPVLSHFFVPDPPPSSSSCPPPLPPPSSYPTTAFAAPPVLCPTGFSAATSLPKSSDTLAPRHAAVGPRNAGGFLPDLPRPPGLCRRRAVLLPALPPAVLSIVASFCTVVLSNAAGSATPPPPGARTPTLPLVLPNWVLLTQAN
jgi:hypothetical protein